MNEATVVNLFLLLRVLLVGGFLLILPRITRKGLLLGAYVGEEIAEGAQARKILREWDLGCWVIMVLSLVVGLAISVAGRPVAGNLTGTAVLLLAALGLYLRTYPKARELAPVGVARQAKRAAAPLQPGKSKGAGFAKLSLGLCLLVGLATTVYAMVAYAAMPDRVPALFPSGTPDELSEKSMVTVLFVPSLSLILTPFFALLALLTAGAKRSMRGGSGGGSLAAQDAFRAANVVLLSCMALLLCGLLTLFSAQTVRVGLGQTHSLGAAVWIVAVVVPVYMLGGLIWIISRHGQGGALREAGSAESPLTGGLADNTHWVSGLFYVDREDPSIMVEKRFGFGYALNYGNRRALLIVGTFLVLLLSLTALGLIGAML